MSVELVGLATVLVLGACVLVTVVALGVAAGRLVDRLLANRLLANRLLSPPDDPPREPYADPSAETVPTVVCVTCHSRYPAGDVHDCAQGPDIRPERLVA